MRVEWLNEEMTEAIVTRGWWRWKEWAQVFLSCEGGFWYFREKPGMHVSFWMGVSLDEARSAGRRQKQNTIWRPVASIPVAKLLSDSAQG